MKLASVLNPDFVYTGLRGSSAQEIYSDMLRRMLPAMELEGDVAGMVQEITAREDAIGVTYDGVAYPHLRLDGYDDLQGPLCREVEEAEVQSHGVRAAPLNQEDGTAEVLPSHHHPDPGFVESRALAETTTL